MKKEDLMQLKQNNEEKLCKKKLHEKE